MGKQKGEGARSKARPSSSNLASSLVPSGTATIGFGGFVGGSRVDSILPVEDTASFADVDRDIALHLRRLARKDATTKLKALASLSELFRQKTGKEVVPIIPQWVFEYKRLLVDYNRDVRRATNETMTILVTTAGRDLAPYLKILMGPWWFSQFDPLSEISQAARRSLQAAFPAQGKRVEALILCTTEIFMYLEENLKLTPQSMSDKDVAMDELEEMHQQVISSSLMALATLMDVLVCRQLEEPASENTVPETRQASKAKATAISFAQKIFFTHNMFLDFLKSKSTSIRTATYSVLKSFVKNVPQTFNEETIKTVSPAILGAFHEKDPACHSSMWDTVLLFTKKFPDSWTMVNVQKIVLNRLWQFFKNGCYGSQQVSYPILVFFLDAVPQKLVDGEKFFLDFFQNLWAGRHTSHSSNANQLAFLKALKECYFWALHHASRFYEGADFIRRFQLTLTENVLVKLLWHDFLSNVSLENKERVKFSNPPVELVKDYQNKKLEIPSSGFSSSHTQELGISIVEILSGISCLEHDLLSAFCVTFQQSCLDMFQQGHIPHKITYITNFILLLEQHAVKQGERWPLVQLVGPMLSKSFQLIRSIDSTEAVELLCVSVSVFGPRSIIQELHIPNERNYSSGCEEGNSEGDCSHFTNVFRNIFVPWCLSESTRSINARLDLVIALIDNDYFSDQWSTVITYVIKPNHSVNGLLSLEQDNISMLSLLVEKARQKLQKRKAEGGIDHRKGSLAEHWHHELLDLAAISVACSPPTFGPSAAKFIGEALGGATDDNQTSLLSTNVMLLIFEEVFKKLLTFIAESPFRLVRDAAALLTSGTKFLILPFESSAEVLEMARFALDILEGSFFWLATFDKESGLVSCILAVLFILGWEPDMVKAIYNDGFDDELNKVLHPRLNFGQSVRDFCCKLSELLQKKLSIESRRRAGIMLIQSIKSVFKECALDPSKAVSLCGLWVLEVLGCLAFEHDEEQNLLDYFLGESDIWPLWIIPDLSTGEGTATIAKENSMDVQRKTNKDFAAVVDILISKIGFSKVVAGDVSLKAQSPTQTSTNELVILPSHSRPWLAAEMLCAWKWQGGSALGSFLPLLVSYAKNEEHPPSESLLDSIFNILLDGALSNGTNGKLYILSSSSALSDEVASIEEPYLRALASLTRTLFKNNIWHADKALIIFDLLTSRLFIGESLNRDCLRILPVLMSILIQPLLCKSSVSAGSSNVAQLENVERKRIQEAIKDWLQRATLLPPLMTQLSEQELEEWLHLVISCYPLSAQSGVEAFNLERDIDFEESTLLIELFRKQSRSIGPSAWAKQLPVVQILLSNIIVVSLGYCWKEFCEEDWEFVLSQIKSSIQSSVVMMEEVTEDVNDILNNSLDDAEATLNRVEKTVTQSDPSLGNIATNSLSSFLMFCDLVRRQSLEVAVTPYSVISEKWDPIKERIQEGILRLFLCTGVTEAIVSSWSPEASSIIALTRLDRSNFWKLVALNVIKSSADARDRAVKSFEFWGLSKGAISSMYAILFSSQPFPSLQFAAFVILSTEPVLSAAIAKEVTVYSLVNDTIGGHNFSDHDSPPEENLHLRDEISHMIEKLPKDVLGMELLENERVHLFLVWSLLLAHLSSLPSASAERERLVQYIQESANSAILDCLFEHISSELGLVQNLRKKADLPAGLFKAATAATNAIQAGSLLFAVESLWPVDTVKMASLACAIFGLMLRVLPAYVRGWFADLRDRSTSQAVEYFTQTWCSPPLISDELSQIKMSGLADENFSVSVSKSSNEIVATYTKDETGMDLLIRLHPIYPLRPVDVDCTRSLGTSEAKQRKWLLSMIALVRTQNGALAEAIRRWKSNFDKQFEGVEECPICYSVIHPVNHSIPGLACKTCKYKFHSVCLYKWFSTSNKSTCPLCQSPF